MVGKFTQLLKKSPYTVKKLILMKKKSMHISSNSIEKLNLFREEMFLTAYIMTIKAVRAYLSEDNRQAEHFGTLENQVNVSASIK